MQRTDLACEVSWSASRAAEHERCPREAWFARYRSWGWWKERPRGPRWRALVHKHLSPLPAFAGDCVHRALARWFEARRAGGFLGPDELFVEARALFREGWRQSAGDGWCERPHRSVHLFEHHYGLPIPRARTDAVRDLLERCARAFHALPELRGVREAEPADWRAVEALDAFELEGVKVFAVPDLALERDGLLHVVDWKTGRPRPGDRRQLELYGLFARARWGVDAARLRLHAAYLGEGRVETVAPDDAALERARDDLARGIAALAAVHYDPDAAAPDPAHWPARGAPERCPSCRFRGLCNAAPAQLRDERGGPSDGPGTA